ncbi:MAG: patatin-like phospholipase family protein [Alphaproteobacteria bacterium]|nr:patatin-like phospholipase family protein [Alphaproteobacteria bacterium]
MISDSEKPNNHPLIAFALGGGAAKGWAHIGMLSYLDEAGIKPELICGTSMGAVAGACYAAGKLDELKEFAFSMTKRRMFSFMDVRLGGGIIKGSHLVTELSKYFGDMHIEDLNIPFVAIATELATGHEIWLRDGKVVPAMRASFAMPGVFSPLDIDGRWLTDGALVNPIPVSVCRAFGARIVIAFGLTSAIYLTKNQNDDFYDQDLEGDKRGTMDMVKEVKQGLHKIKTSEPNIGTVTMASFNIMQDRIARTRLAGDPPDALITPNVEHIGAFEFDKAQELYDLGYEAAHKALPSILNAIRNVGV